MALHSEYVNNQITTLTNQAKELSKRAAKCVVKTLNTEAEIRVLRVRTPGHFAPSGIGMTILCIAIFLLQCIKTGIQIFY